MIYVTIGSGGTYSSLYNFFQNVTTPLTDNYTISAISDLVETQTSTRTVNANSKSIEFNFCGHKVYTNGTVLSMSNWTSIDDFSVHDGKFRISGSNPISIFSCVGYLNESVGYRDIRVYNNIIDVATSTATTNCFSILPNTSSRLKVSLYNNIVFSTTGQEISNFFNNNINVNANSSGTFCNNSSTCHTTFYAENSSNMKKTLINNFSVKYDSYLTSTNTSTAFISGNNINADYSSVFVNTTNWDDEYFFMPKANSIASISGINPYLGGTLNQNTLSADGFVTYKNGFTVLSGGPYPIGAVCPPRNIDPPTNIAATITRTDDVRISWTPTSGVDGYYVYRSLSDHIDNFRLATPIVVSGGSSTGYTDTNVLPGITYYYKVRSYKV